MLVKNFKTTDKRIYTHLLRSRVPATPEERTGNTDIQEYIRFYLCSFAVNLSLTINNVTVTE